MCWKPRPDTFECRFVEIFANCPFEPKLYTGLVIVEYQHRRVVSGEFCNFLGPAVSVQCRLPCCWFGTPEHENAPVRATVARDRRQDWIAERCIGIFRRRGEECGRPVDQGHCFGGCFLLLAHSAVGF